MKQFNVYSIPLAIVLLLQMGSCQKNAFFDAGEIVSQEIHLENKISSIEVNTMLDITLVQDTINLAIVTCGENLLPDIDIFIKDDVLHLNNTIKYCWSRSYEKIKLELHLISIPQLNIRMPAYITTRDTFKTDEFFLVDWGTFTELDVMLDVNRCVLDVSSEDFGHYTIKGKAIDATFNDWGSSFMYAEGLQVQNCKVNQRSIGDIYVNVSNVLEVNIATTGKVYYYNNPSTIIVDDSQKDRLIHLTNK